MTSESRVLTCCTVGHTREAAKGVNDRRNCVAEAIRSVQITVERDEHANDAKCRSIAIVPLMTTPRKYDRR
jgi:hypothetical protein